MPSIFPGDEAGALLHPVRAGEARPASSRSPAWRISADAARRRALVRDGTGPADGQAADPLARPRRLGRLLGAQPRSAARDAIRVHRSTTIAAPGAATARLPDGVASSDMADDVLALMDGARHRSAAMSSAMRLGGLIGLALALTHAERLDRLVVVNGWARPDPHFAALLRRAAGRCCARAAPQAYRARPADLPLSGALDLANMRAARRRGGAASSAHFPGAANVETRIAALARLRRRRSARRDRDADLAHRRRGRHAGARPLARSSSTSGLPTRPLATDAAGAATPATSPIPTPSTASCSTS